MSDKFALIAAEQAAHHDDQLAVTSMCQALRVSRSGFYDWARAEPSARAVRRAKVAVHLKAAFALGRGTYGVRRVHAVLARSHDPEVSSVSLDLVRNLMQENDLHACQPRAYKVTTVQDEAGKHAIVDHVKRDFTATAPGTKLVGDITYSAQPRVMCSPAGRPSRCMTIARGATAHNHRSCRKARSRSPGLNRVGAGLGSPRCCRTASLAARSASRY